MLGRLDVTSLWAPARRVGGALLDVLLPPMCQVCEQGASELCERVLCADCGMGWESVEALCLRCGATEQPSEEGLCPRCVAKPPPFSLARSGWCYAGALEQAIHAVKYQKAEALGRYLGRRLAQRLELLPVDVRYGAVIPVPLHWKRRFWRGYNQAELLASPVSLALGVPLELRLGRAATFSNLARLGRQERAETIAGAFSIPAQVARALAGQAVLVVDDVYTTGATVGAFAQALLQAGVARVDVFTLARTA